MTAIEKIVCHGVFQRVENLILDADGLEYGVLLDAARRTADLEGLSIELGTRMGGSAELVMRTYHDTKALPQPHICVDPYGDLPYQASDSNTLAHGLGYSCHMRRRAQAALYDLAERLQQDLLFLPFEDTEFFQRFADGVPVYQGGAKRSENRYRLVFIDGPHTRLAVQRAAQFFASRVVREGMIVFDNIGYYDHAPVHEQMLAHDFEHIYSGTEKASYRRKLT